MVAPITTSALLAILLIVSPSRPLVQSEELTGDWVSACTRLPERHSVSATLSFSETTVTAMIEMFSDNSCQSLNLRGEYRALVSVGGRVGAGREIDFAPTRVTMTILNPEVAAIYNRNAGNGAWQIGEPRDVSGMSLGPYQMPTVGSTIYDVYEAGSGELRFGGFPEQIAATQPGDRPASLSSLFRFVRPQARL